MRQKLYLAFRLTLFGLIVVTTFTTGESKIVPSSPKETLSTEVYNVNKRELNSGDVAYEYEEDQSEEEEDCPQNQFWHIRGQHCVPTRCPGGNKYRDANTGNCIISTLHPYPNRIFWGRPRGIWRNTRYSRYTGLGGVGRFGTIGMVKG